MTKNLLFSLTTFFFVPFLSAQVTLTYATHGIVVGDAYTVFDANSATTNPGSSGINQTWNFSNITVDTNSSSTTIFVNPATTPYTANFPIANLAGKRGIDNYFYYISTSTSLIYLGYANPFDTVVYSDPEMVSQYPFAITNNFSDPWTFLNDSIYEFGSVYQEADGTGTLILPSGNYSVLRVTTGSGYEDSSATSDFLTSKTSTQWYSATSKFWLFTINNYTVTDLLSTGVGSYSEIIINSSVVGMNENNSSPIHFDLFPNPTTENANLNFTIAENQQVNILVSDLQGRTILNINRGELSPGDYTETIDLSTLPKGMYMVNVKGEKSFASRKLIVE